MKGVAKKGNTRGCDAKDRILDAVDDMKNFSYLHTRCDAKNRMRDAVDAAWSNKDKDFCLCVGSGVTRRFVGTWPELLDKLLYARMVNRWLADYGLDEISNFIQNENAFRFFEGTGNLEQGDYLLSDDREQNVFHSESDRQAWQEKYFSKQVSLVLEKKIRDFCADPLQGMKDSCKGKGCHTNCPVYSGHVQSVADVFSDLKKANEAAPFSTREERHKVYKNCCLYHELSTLMAVVELCLTGAVRFVINYNFDTVIEQMLANDEILRIYGRTPDTKLHIHIWTYGTGEGNRFSFMNSANAGCRKQQDGTNAANLSELYQIHYHVGEEWIFQTEKKDTSAIHIFHVHGIGGEPDEWVPDDGTLKIRPLVFSEHSYTEYQKASFNWSNRTLSNLMSNFIIMTVGFSGEDANFRAVARAMKNSNLPCILAGENEFADLFERSPEWWEKGGADCPRIILLRDKGGHRRNFEKTIDNCSAFTSTESGNDTGDLQEKQTQVEKQVYFFSGVFEKMVENYYRNYFDIAVYWEEDFDRIAGFLMERTDSFPVT